MHVLNMKNDMKIIKNTTKLIKKMSRTTKNKPKIIKITSQNTLKYHHFTSYTTSHIHRTFSCLAGDT